MLYLYLLRRDQPPTQELFQRTLSKYRSLHGPGVQVLGGMRVTGSLPREPDVYVVTVCYEVCRKNNLSVSPDNRIAYGVDIVDGEDIGVCQIGIG